MRYAFLLVQAKSKFFKIRPSPAKAEPANQRKKLGFPWIPSSESGLFKGLRRPPRAKNLLVPPFPAGLAPGRASFDELAKGSTISVFRKVIFRIFHGQSRLHPPARCGLIIARSSLMAPILRLASDSDVLKGRILRSQGALGMAESRR
jgi:hypothetical protein